MEIKTLNDLKKIVQLCRKQGVQSLSLGTLVLHLGPAPRQASKPIDYSSDIPESKVQIPKFTGEISAPEPVSTDELTAEQLLMWSVGGTAAIEGQQ